MLVPGIDTPLPVQFYIPENFEDKDELISVIENNGGVVVSKINSLSHQLCNSDDTNNINLYNMCKHFYNGYVFKRSLIQN